MWKNDDPHRHHHRHGLVVGNRAINDHGRNHRTFFDNDDDDDDDDDDLSLAFDSDIQELFKTTSMKLDQLLEDIRSTSEEETSTSTTITTTGRLAMASDKDDDEDDEDDEDEEDDEDDEDDDDDDEELLLMEALSAEWETTIPSPPPWNTDGSKRHPSNLTDSHHSWKSYLQKKVMELSKNVSTADGVSRTEEKKKKKNQEACAGSSLSSPSSLSSFGRMASFESIEDLENQVRITQDFKLVRMDDDEKEETRPPEATTGHPKDYNQGGGGTRSVYNQENDRDDECIIETDCSETVKSSSTTQSSFKVILPPDTQLSDDLPRVSKPLRTKERCHTPSSTDQSQITATMDKDGSTTRAGQTDGGASASRCGLPSQRCILASLLVSVVLALVILFVTLSGKNGTEPSSRSTSDVLTPAVRRHTSAPTSAPTNQVTVIPTTTFLLDPRMNNAEQEVINGEHIEEITMEARVESSSTTNHATVRAEAVKQQRLRTEAMWGNVAHQGAPKIQASSSKGSKVPYSKKAVQ